MKIKEKAKPWLRTSLKIAGTAGALFLALLPVISVQAQPPERAAWVQSGLMAWESDRDGNSEIYLRLPDAEEVNLTQNPAKDAAPCLSPDGRRIAFVSDRSGENQIFVMDTDGGVPKQLTTIGNVSEPDWSRDGSRIAFSAHGYIYVMGSDGGEPRQLTETGGEKGDFEPSSSPDGGRITFHSARDGDLDIYVMNADGSNETNPTNHSRAGEYNSKFSPVENKIVFESDASGISELFVMEANGTTTQISKEIPSVGNSCWSPDGRSIAFNANRAGNTEIYVMDVYGQQFQVTSHGATDAYPSWSGG